MMKKAEHILAAIDGKEEARCETSLLCGTCPYEANCPARKCPQIEIPEDVIAVSRLYLELTEQKKQLEAQIEALKDDLLNYTGDKFSRSHDGISIRSYKIKDSVTVDSKKLQKDYPDVYAACSKPKAGYIKLEVSAVAVEQQQPDLLQQAA